MKYPLASILFSLLIWIIIIIFTAFIFSQNNNNLSDLENNRKFAATIATVEIVDDITDDIAIYKTKQNQNNSNNSNNNYSNVINNQNNKQGAAPLYRPLPNIPDDLREEAFNSDAIARFHIKADGSAKVELIKPCFNSKLNYLLLENLKKWRFSEAAQDSVQDIRISFKVE